MLLPFNPIPHVMVTPNHKTIPTLLYNCNSAAVTDYNVTIGHAGYLTCNPCNKVTQPTKGGVTHSLRTSVAERGQKVEGVLQM